METNRYNGWLDWRYLEMNARFRKAIQFPTRERTLVREVLRKMGFRYKEIMAFYNPLRDSNPELYKGSIQWVDFFVYVPNLKRRLIAIQFDVKNRHGGVLKRKQEIFNTRKTYLEQQGVPVLIVSRYWTSQIYEMRLRMFLNKLEKQ